MLQLYRIAMFSRKPRIWERLTVSHEELDKARSSDSIMDEICRDFEEVVEALRRAEAKSQTAGEVHTPDLELVRLARELAEEIDKRLSTQAEQPRQR